LWAFVKVDFVFASTTHGKREREREREKRK
jgi:hypothetical protein